MEACDKMHKKQDGFKDRNLTNVLNGNKAGISG